MNEKKGDYKTEGEPMGRSAIEAGKTRTLKNAGCGTQLRFTRTRGKADPSLANGASSG
jgi:hypothetical protein